MTSANVFQEIQQELNWMRLILDVYRPDTPRPLARELRRRLLVMQGLLSEGRPVSTAVKESTKGTHDR